MLFIRVFLCTSVPNSPVKPEPAKSHHGAKSQSEANIGSRKKKTLSTSSGLTKSAKIFVPLPHSTKARGTTPKAGYLAHRHSGSQLRVSTGFTPVSPFAQQAIRPVRTFGSLFNCQRQHNTTKTILSNHCTRSTTRPALQKSSKR